MDAPSVRTTFVIATRNRAAELATVVERLLDTTACPITIVDNDSDDDSAQVVSRIADGSADRVQLIELDSNRGAVARNIGVAVSDTPYIAFCDDDSWWEPDAATIGADVFDRHPGVGLLAARTVVLPEGREDPLCRQLATSPLGRRPDSPGPSILGFMACAAMVRRSAFKSAGGFSEILHFRGEEQLLAIDMASLGWQLCYCPTLVALHQPSQVRDPTAAQQARVLRNDVLTAWLRRPLPHCVKTTGNLIAAARTDREHGRALVEALARFPTAVSRRRRLPADVEQALSRLESA